MDHRHVMWLARSDPGGEYRACKHAVKVSQSGMRPPIIVLSEKEVHEQTIRTGRTVLLGSL